ncbi:phosphocholine cytidylyltransferase family protein [Kocuria sp.]|uniref:phosphocholine cytidylyltransferase family protein n=1 Tax=Kocuria sp. TaxID=1871328 RepID=UPI0026E09ACA|nr:NTP transferase domain-containing protein [Kocuria sp.]MDO5618522.1 NTP transferase domain-containing protein [Kocuria sp.]
MIGIVPAAGLGRRLGTALDMPKPLLELGGHSLIGTVLSRLDEMEITRIVVVLGHAEKAVRSHVEGLDLRHPVEFIVNECYQTTNNLYSLSLTIPWWDEGFLVSDSDLLTSPAVVRRLWDTPGSGIVVDTSRSDTFDLGAQVEEGRVVKLSKNIPVSEASGEGLGMSIWRSADAAVLAEEVRSMLVCGGEDLWYPYAMSEAAKRVLLLQVAVGPEEWWEVDTQEDLVQGRRRATALPAWAPLPRVK